MLRRSSHEDDRPALYAAQFALGHGCWLIAYPLSGWLMTAFGAVVALLILAAVGGVGILVALSLWPVDDPVEVSHIHDNLPLDHPHLNGQRSHSHAYVVDDNHPRWASHL